MTENSDKLDNMTVRRFAKLIKGNGTSNGSTGITTGTVIQNDNQLYVAVDDETLVPVSDTASNVKVGDKVTLAIDNEEALIVGNNSDASPTASELSETDTKATFAKVDASEAKDTAQTAQTTADNAQSTASEAQSTAKQAISDASDASKVATNYIKIDDNEGIIVGNMEGTLGKNTYITADGVSIRDGETTVASFGEDKIALGVNKRNSTISLCSDFIQIWGDSEGSEFTSPGYFSFKPGNADAQEGCIFTIGRRMFQCIQSSKGEVVTDIEFQNGGIGIGGSAVSTTPFLIVADGENDEGYIKASNIYQGDDKVSVEGHTHTQSDITDFAHTHVKDDITDFSHTHTKSEITDFAHVHTGDALTPATINTTSTIKQNGTQVSLEGHTHEANDLTTSTPIFYLKTLSQTYTCNKASTVTVNFSIPAITGYTCVGCVDWQFGNGSMHTRWNFAYNTKLWSLYGYNIGSSTVSGTAKVKLLYVKSGWISCS